MTNGNQTKSYPEEILHCLEGKRAALIGFKPDDIDRFDRTVEEFQFFTRSFEHAEISAGPEKLRPYDLLVTRIPETAGEDGWLSALTASQASKPLLLTGPSQMLFQKMATSWAKHYDFLASPWSSEEVVLRIYHLLSGDLRRNSPAADGRVEGKARVLIADDDLTVTTMVGAILKKYGMECLVAHNGSEAVQLARSNAPLAAILDINMPSLNGFEVLTAIKNDPQTSKIAVILLTSRQQENDVMRGFALGADDYVGKPFSPMELAARLKRLLPRSASEGI